ncbi:hypothetical protein QN277_019664 [Acacia crassicarpa]|uniref:Uncharacterized protein n=1 Tax=Acacia crassicarpa TaxID=499986 RepID=A0AAE1JMT1_9FABA|nr:hypothetical protein QN277_019664 [Acacia crassicarpa]
MERSQATAVSSFLLIFITSIQLKLAVILFVPNSATVITINLKVLIFDCDPHWFPLGSKNPKTRDKWFTDVDEDSSPYEGPCEFVLRFWRFIHHNSSHSITQCYSIFAIKGYMWKAMKLDPKRALVKAYFMKNSKIIPML